MNNLSVGDEITLKIDKLVNEGKGLGHIDNFAVFVNSVCPDEVVKCKIISLTKNYAKAQLKEIVTPSPFRVKPFCALYNVCGGCQLQHLDYQEQLNQKKNIVAETIRKIAGYSVEVLPAKTGNSNKNFRQKIQMPVAQTKNSKRFLIGFYKENTHDIVNIKYCPIQPEYFNEIIAYIREEAFKIGITAYNEKKHSGELRHVVFRNSSSENKCTLILVVNQNSPTKEILKLAKSLTERFSDIKGIILNYNTQKSNIILSNKFETVEGVDFIYQNIDNTTFKISAGSFFQVNPDAAEKILDTIKSFVKKYTTNPTVLDAYCGVGSLGLWLKDIAKEVYSVEQTPSSVSDAKENLKINNVNNFHIFEGDVKDIFDNFIKQNLKFNVVITDPPRQGCSETALNQIADLAQKYIIYVSCNPATLARDLKLLKEKGFIAKYVQPVDMFCHSYHIENVVWIEKMPKND